MLTKNAQLRVNFRYRGSSISRNPPVARNTTVKRKVDMMMKGFSATPRATPMETLSYLKGGSAKKEIVMVISTVVASQQ